MIKEIEETFKNIPAFDILTIANRAQAALKNNSELRWEKKEGELVTKADLLIQKLLLEYFSESPLAGTFLVKAEETHGEERNCLPNSQCIWQLLIDPLDGTSSFCRGEKTWGTMVGLCDKRGDLIYSWNMISSGEVFSSLNSRERDTMSLQERQKQSKSFIFDVYDYGAGAASHFSKAFEEVSLEKFKSTDIEVTSFPAAVWAGWELFNENIDGLLWLPSSKGKENYPDYDLIFIGALVEQGWKVRIGKTDREKQSTIQMVAISRSEEMLEMLWKTGLLISPGNRNVSLFYETDLLITSSIDEEEER